MAACFVSLWTVCSVLPVICAPSPLVTMQLDRRVSPRARHWQLARNRELGLCAVILVNTKEYRHCLPTWTRTHPWREEGRSFRRSRLFLIQVIRLVVVLLVRVAKLLHNLLDLGLLFKTLEILFGKAFECSLSQLDGSFGLVKGVQNPLVLVGQGLVEVPLTELSTRILEDGVCWTESTFSHRIDVDAASWMGDEVQHTSSGLQKGVW